MKSKRKDPLDLVINDAESFLVHVLGSGDKLKTK